MRAGSWRFLNEKHGRTKFPEVFQKSYLFPEPFAVWQLTDDN